MKTIQSLLVSSAMVFALYSAGCSDAVSTLEDVPPGAEEVPEQLPPSTCLTRQKTYKGLGGIDLAAKRLETPVGQERFRLKPYESLSDDYLRIVGVVPSVLAESGPTFGAPAARWYAEPKPEAVTLYQAYRIGFEACLMLTAKDAKYDVAPTAETAAAECATIERKYWSRTPSPKEIQACVDVAVTDSQQETKPGGGGMVPTPNRRRWAYSCASVLASPDFIAF